MSGEAATTEGYYRIKEVGDKPPAYTLFIPGALQYVLTENHS